MFLIHACQDELNQTGLCKPVQSSCLQRHALAKLRNISAREIPIIALPIFEPEPYS